MDNNYLIKKYNLNLYHTTTDRYKHLIEIATTTHVAYHDYTAYKADLISATKMLVPDCSDTVITEYVNTDNYHDYFDRTDGDMRLDWFIRKSDNIMYNTVWGHIKYMQLLKLEAYLFYLSGYDFADKTTVKKYVVATDILFIRHHCNYYTKQDDNDNDNKKQSYNNNHYIQFDTATMQADKITVISDITRTQGRIFHQWLRHIVLRYAYGRNLRHCITSATRTSAIFASSQAFKSRINSLQVNTISSASSMLAKMIYNSNTVTQTQTVRNKIYYCKYDTLFARHSKFADKYPYIVDNQWITLSVSDLITIISQHDNKQIVSSDRRKIYTDIYLYKQRLTAKLNAAKCK